MGWVGACWVGLGWVGFDLTINNDGEVVKRTTNERRTNENERGQAELEVKEEEELESEVKAEVKAEEGEEES